MARTHSDGLLDGACPESPIRRELVRSIDVSLSGRITFRPIAHIVGYRMHCLLGNTRLYLMAWIFVGGSIPIESSAEPHTRMSSLMPDTIVGSGVADVGYFDYIETDRRTTPFLVAVTPTEILTAREVPAKQPGRPRERWVTYVGNHLEHAVLLLFQSRGDEINLHAIDGLSLRNVVLQEDYRLADVSSLVHLSQHGAFQDFSPPLFRAMPFQGVSSDIIARLANDRGLSPKTFKNEYGKLVVATVEDAISTFEFHQISTDAYATNVQDFLLRDYEYGPFERGLASQTYRCRFTPPFSSRIVPPWSATYEVEQVGINGKQASAISEIEVTAWSTDPEEAVAMIDKYLSLIPEGEPIVARGQIAYIWSDRGIEKRVDHVGVDVAEGAKFRQRSSYIVLVNVVIVAVLASAILGRALLASRKDR